MIASISKAPSDERTKPTRDRFLEMLPFIQRQASRAFGGLRAEAREEMIQGTLASAFCAFNRLVSQGKEARAFASPLADFAIRRVRSGRCVGCRPNINDVMSGHCRRARGLTVERLDHRDAQIGGWSQQLVESRHAGPAETAAARIDIVAWLRQLSRRDRRIAQLLARGERTHDVAKQFRLSSGRVSQLRNELYQNWQQFQAQAA
jgi:hypothetical protein